MDLATAANEPREVELGGMTYKVSLLTPRQWAPLQAYIRDHVPDPVTVAVGELAQARALGIEVTPADRQFLLAEARKDAKAWPPALGSQEWFRVLDGDEGRARFLLTVLGKHQPSLTIEQARDLADRLTIDEILPVIRSVFGVEDRGPKVPGPAATNGALSSTPSPAATASSPMTSST
jgi:hypothetical protein